MINILNQVFSLFFGVFLGTIFFGGLWWTIQKSILAKQPAIWFLLSLLLRSAIVLTGFYFVGHSDWQKLISCVIGFLVVRIFANYLVRITTKTTPLNKGARNAS